MKTFNKKMSLVEFRSQYWYKTDLQKICKEYNLPTYGTKAELQKYIEEFLNGNKEIKPNRNRRKSKKIILSEITLDTKILESGFSLNKVAREWFKNYYNTDKFSFNKSMAIKMREIEETHDESATISDLIVAHDSKIKAENKEEKTYEWNHFVKDFNNDSRTKKFGNNKLIVASFLWKKVKNSNSINKDYDSSLLKTYKSEIDKLINSLD